MSMEREAASIVEQKQRHTPLATDILVCQGIAALVFLLCFALLLAIANLPLQWRDGELGRLIALLWAMPAAAVMTTRYAILNLDEPDRPAYLNRMRNARLGALFLAVVAVPVLQWQLLDGQPDWMTRELALPILVSLLLCLVASLLAQRLMAGWFLLQTQPWESPNKTAEWSDSALYAMMRRVDKARAPGVFWSKWLIGGTIIAVALLICDHATSDPAIPTLWGVPIFFAYMAIGPVLISHAARTRRQAHWAAHRVQVSAEVPQYWGRLAFTPVLAALFIADLLPLSGLFSVAHGAIVRLATSLSLPSPDTVHPVNPFSAPSTAAAPVPTDIPSSTFASSSVVPPTSLPTGSSWGVNFGGFNIDLLGMLPTLAMLAALGILIWSAVWVRRRESHGVSRWLVLATLAMELAAYLRWLSHALTRRRAPAQGQAIPVPKVNLLAQAQRVRCARIEGLAPRQAIIALYLSALEHMAKRGYARRIGQTPREHAREVGQSMRVGRYVPMQMADLFSDARYSPQQIQPAQLTRMQMLWVSLRRGLRRRVEGS